MNKNVTDMNVELIIKRNYVRKYLQMMVVEQLLDDYRQQGYEIKTQYPISATLRADLFAVKGDDRVVIELVYGRIPDEAMQQLEHTVTSEGFRLEVIDISKVKLEH